MNTDIDIVVPWVDDSDPEWLEERRKYSSCSADCDAVRFRDWDLMRYWFRSVEKHMPWVRKIHFVTCGHYPKWLELTNPKLNLVKHSDYIPKENLPTFSANPIELNLHRIEDLSEQFIYFNDDMYIGSKVSPEDFFVDGKPCGSAVLSPLIALEPQWSFGHILLNDIALMNAHFRLKDTLKGNLGKWFSPKYGRYALKNLYNAFGRNYFLGFEAFHEPSSMLKSTYEKVWKMAPDILEKTSSHKFRNPEDVNQYIMSYYNYCTNNFVPRSPKGIGYFDIGNDNKELCEAIKTYKFQFIIANDSAAVDDFETVKKELTEALEEAFPNPSSFEI